jgi:transposase
MMKPISREKEANIVALLIKGKSTREVAKSLGFSQSIVNRMRRKHCSSLELPQRGRREILTTSEKRLAVRLVIVGGLETAVEAAKVLRVNREVGFCDNTLQNALRDAGSRACEKIPKPSLSQKNVQERLYFATIHKDWTIENWKRVVFSNETKIICFNADGRSWYWVNDKENVPNCTMKQTVKYGGGSIMLWSCMTARGLGDLQRVEGRINAKDYIALLHGDLYLSLERLGYFNLDKVIFQYDNVPIHKVRIVQKWLLEQPFNTLEWPTQSPDLNPIERVWATLKRHLNSYSTPPTSLLQSWERVEESFRTITTNDCERLYANMLDRIAAVLAAHGKWTDFLVLFTYGLKK